ncbi:MAG: hypothetical protein PF445_01610 [Melioribacteraceae bacterium]|jgi:hypothetical protein|nr:hypothetical protein [Melioribacteraceae bacterium]
MRRTKSSLIEQRAEAIAYLFLSKFENLEILRNVGTQFNFDFLVSATLDRKIVGKFGIELKSKKHITKNNLTNIPIKLKNFIPFDPIPLMLFLVDTSTKSIYFDWLREPVIVQNRGHIEDYEHSPSLTKIDTEKFKQQIQKVLEYYHTNPNHT